MEQRCVSHGKRGWPKEVVSYAFALVKQTYQFSNKKYPLCHGRDDLLKLRGTGQYIMAII